LVSSQSVCTLTCSFCHTGTQAARAQPHVPARSSGQIWFGARSPRSIGWEAPERGGFADAGRALRLQHRHDGHWGERSTFGGGATRSWIAADERGDRHFQAPHHALDVVAWWPNIFARGREIGCMLAVRCTPCATSCATISFVHRNIDRAKLLDACRDYPGVSNARAHSRSIRHAQGRQ